MNALSQDRYVTDGGLETVLVFHDGLDLPAFAAFPLLGTTEGTARLEAYYRDYAEVAQRHSTGLVVETPTWRANPDWGRELGFDADALAQVQRDAVALGRRLGPDAVVSGCLGPRGDGYVVGTAMSADEAAGYHRAQVATFADAGVDLVTTMTFTYADEAVGVVEAAVASGVPVVVGFTVETDGRLPSGQPLGEAVVEVDTRTGAAPAWYLVNCAHPDHVGPAFTPGAPWLGRIGALRANASRLSHAELDEMEVLDDGDPAELAVGCHALAEHLPALRVLGGCCGTDVRHVEALAATWPVSR